MRFARLLLTLLILGIATALVGGVVAVAPLFPYPECDGSVPNISAPGPVPWGINFMTCQAPPNPTPAVFQVSWVSSGPWPSGASLEVLVCNGTALLAPQASPTDVGPMGCSVVATSGNDGGSVWASDSQGQWLVIMTLGVPAGMTNFTFNSSLPATGLYLITTGALLVVAMVLLGERQRRKPPASNLPKPKAEPEVPTEGLEPPPPGYTWVVRVRKEDEGRRRK